MPSIRHCNCCELRCPREPPVEPGFGLTSRTIGIQYSDWHALLTPRIPEMRVAVKAARTNPALDRFIDFDLLDHTLDNWPVESSLDDAVYFPCAFTLPRALAMVRYVEFMTGRNQVSASESPADSGERNGHESQHNRIPA